jgi:hypothetical protein
MMARRGAHWFRMVSRSPGPQIRGCCLNSIIINY